VRSAELFEADKTGDGGAEVIEFLDQLFPLVLVNKRPRPADGTGFDVQFSFESFSVPSVPASNIRRFLRSTESVAACSTSMSARVAGAGAAGAEFVIADPGNAGGRAQPRDGIGKTSILGRHRGYDPQCRQVDDGRGARDAYDCAVVRSRPPSDACGNTGTKIDVTLTNNQPKPDPRHPERHSTR
jgi:hypothetical protein